MPLISAGQVVSTLVTTPLVRGEAITYSASGYMYSPISTGGILKIAPDGSFTQIGSNFQAAYGGGMDNNGNFYFSEYGTNKVWIIRPDDSYNVFATGFFGPTGIVVSPDGSELYVANYNNNSIRTLSLADSSHTLFTAGGGIDGPDGIVFDDDGNLVVANWDNNHLHKVSPTGVVSYFTTLTGNSNSGYIVKSGSDFYCTSVFEHRIVKVDSSGNVSALAGTGVGGYMDGPGATAQFVNPNGIAVNSTGDTLFVTDGEANSTGYIRAIDIATITTVEEQTPQTFNFQLETYPNPSAGEVNISFHLDESAQVELTVYDNKGQVVEVLLSGQKTKGLHQIAWDASTAHAQGIYYLKLNNGVHSTGTQVVYMER